MRNWLPPVLLTVLWATVLAILLTPEPPQGHGLPHAQFRAMDQGGAGLQRHDSVLVLGWLFGSVLIAIFVSLLAWAATSNHRSRHAPRDEAHHAKRDSYCCWAFVLGALLYEGVFAALCLAYCNSLESPQAASFWGPFPTGTSWLLFGIWGSPLFFILLYVVFFNRWIMPPQHLNQFEELVNGAREERS